MKPSAGCAGSTTTTTECGKPGIPTPRWKCPPPQNRWGALSAVQPSGRFPGASECLWKCIRNGCAPAWNVNSSRKRTDAGCAAVSSKPKPHGSPKSARLENGPSMNPETPNIELLNDILIPVRMILERLYWQGFRDGAALTGLIFFVVFILTNRGVKG